jgi:hypothetical protein
MDSNIPEHTIVNPSKQFSKFPYDTASSRSASSISIKSSLESILTFLLIGEDFFSISFLLVLAYELISFYLLDLLYEYLAYKSFELSPVDYLMFIFLAD